MGSAISVAQQNQIPALLDRKAFYAATGTSFQPDAYDCFVDHDGLVSKDRLIEIVSSADLYISHDWGLDGQARSNRDRALRIGNYLSSKGLFINADNGPSMNRAVGDDGTHQVEMNIQRAQVVLVCISSRYCDQLVQAFNSTVKQEFFAALQHKGPRFMLPILMEKSAKLNPDTSVDVIYDLFKNKYTVDACDFEDHFTTKKVQVGYKTIKVTENSILDDLYDCIVRTIKPLRNGGSYQAQHFDAENTVSGRHYHWLKTHLPQYDHITCQRFSALFASAGVTTSSKLFHRIQCDDKYLLKLGVPPADAKLITKKLHDDIVGNMNPVTGVKAAAMVRRYDEEERARLDGIREATQVTDDIAIKNNETRLMLEEDALSFEYREEWRRGHISRLFGEAKMALLLESLEQTNQLQSRIFLAQKVLFQQYCTNIDAQRTEEYIRITRITSAVHACVALRHLLLKVQREVDQSNDRPQVAAMMGRPSFRDRVDVVEFVRSTSEEVRAASRGSGGGSRRSSSRGPLLLRNESESPLEELSSEVLLLKYLEDEVGPECSHLVIQQRRATSYIQAAILDRSGIIEDEQTDTGVGEYHGNAIFNLLQEAVVVLRLVVVLARDNPSSAGNIRDFTENSVVKLWTALMNIMYLFDYSFDLSDSLPDPAYHLLSAPLEGLLALKYLAKHSPYRSSVSLRLVYLFGAANTIELCLETIKFHFTDAAVVLAALEGIAVLMDNVEFYREYAARLMRDKGNVMMLLMLLNKYSLGGGGESSEQFEFFKLRVQAVVLNILGLVVRTNQFNALLHKLHIQYILSDGLTAATAAAGRYLDGSGEEYDWPDPVELIEVNTRLLSALDCVYLDHAHIVNYTTTVDVVASPTAINRLIVSLMLPSCAATIEWLSQLLVHYHRDWVFCQYVAYTVGNVVYRNNEAKAECLRRGVIPRITHVAALCMRQLNEGVHSSDSRDGVLDCLVAAANVLAWQHNATNVIAYNDESFKFVRNGEKPRPRDYSGLGVEECFPLAVSLAVREGLCEVAMNALREYSQDRSLVRAALILCCKLTYRGQYEPCHRLVSLGLCEHLVPMFERYREQRDMYLLFVTLFTGLAEAHPNLVGAEKRLLKLGVCKAVTEGLRHCCSVTGARKWSHLNFPFTCRICMQTCQCVSALIRDHSGAAALKKFTAAGFQGTLVKPPELVCEGMTIQDVEFLPGSSYAQRPESEQQQQRGAEEVDEHAPTPLVTAADVAMDDLFEGGRFNRNVEYAENLSTEQKQEIMTALFDNFHIE